MKNTIFFYTNNFLPKPLLEKTVTAVLEHGVRNDAEVIITSHYSVLTEYEFVPQLDPLPVVEFRNIDPMRKLADQTGLLKYLCKDLAVRAVGNCKNYVVGKQPYNPTTIIQQLDCSLKKSYGQNIILMEHDCLYPENYVPVVQQVLDEHDLARVHLSRCYVTVAGFLKYRSIFLNGLSMRRETFSKYLENKKRLLKEQHFLSYLEPYTTGMEAKPDGFIVDNWKVIDGVLGANRDLLDIQHGLNYNQCLHVHGSLLKHAFHTHSYWGIDQQYVELFPKLTRQEKVLCFSGVQELNL